MLFKRILISAFSLTTVISVYSMHQNQPKMEHHMACYLPASFLMQPDPQGPVLLVTRLPQFAQQIQLIEYKESTIAPMPATHAMVTHEETTQRKTNIRMPGPALQSKPELTGRQNKAARRALNAKLDSEKVRRTADERREFIIAAKKNIEHKAQSATAPIPALHSTLTSQIAMHRQEWKDENGKKPGPALQSNPELTGSQNKIQRRRLNRNMRKQQENNNPPSIM
jgi:hypothetical protein